MLKGRPSNGGPQSRIRTPATRPSQPHFLHMPHVPGLRSPYARLGRLVHFGRMLDKIRLNLAGRLPAEYQDNLGDGRFTLFDSRLCRFLGLRYSDVVAEVKQGRTDEEMLAWAGRNSLPRSDEECMVWNRFISKIGWRDDRSEALQERVRDGGLEGRGIETFFDLIEVDEGRDPVKARPWEFKPARILVIMGVAGSGKTTIGLALAEALDWVFADADDFHPPENVGKMTAGISLTDEDRAPWLASIRAYIEESLRNDRSAIITCSALKERYRETILVDPARVTLIYLKGSHELLAERISQRSGHFMKPKMLETQLATLEEPDNALVVDITPKPDVIVANIRAALGI